MMPDIGVGIWDIGVGGDFLSSSAIGEGSFLSILIVFWCCGCNQGLWSEFLSLVFGFNLCSMSGISVSCTCLFDIL